MSDGSAGNPSKDRPDDQVPWSVASCAGGPGLDLGHVISV